MNYDSLKKCILLGEIPETYPITEAFFESVYESYLNKDWKTFWNYLKTEKWFLMFLLVHDELDDKSYWMLMGKILDNGIYFNDYKNVLEYLLNNPSRDIRLRKYMMADEEVLELKKMDSNIIYRGCSKKKENCYLWTLDFRIALRYAASSRGDNMVLKAHFKTEDVLAYFKNEKKIYIKPDDIINPKEILSFGISEDKGERFRISKDKLIKNYIKDETTYKRLELLSSTRYN